MSIDVDPEGRGEESHRGRWAAAAGVVLVLAAVGGLAWLATDVPGEPGRVSALQQAVRLPPVWVPTEPVPPVIAAAPMAIPASAPEVVPPGYIDVCGVGLVKKSEWDAPARTDAMAAAFDRTRERVVQSLVARGDESSRALGLAYQIQRGRVVLDEVVTCQGADCPDPPERVESVQAAAARMASNVAARDELARIAVATRNPQVYALAYGTCKFLQAPKVNDGTACRMLSAEQWARLDPDNGALWLEVAVAARERGDRAGVAEAIHRAGVARRFDSYFGHFAGVMVERLPPDVSELEAFELTMSSVGLESLSINSFHVLTSECSAAAVRDANRSQQCSAVAETLWRRSSDMLQLSIAQSLGKRVGWSAERLDAVRDERDALLHASVMQAEVGHDLSCASLRRQRAYVSSLGKLGELGTLRAAAEASGKSVAELAQASRLRQAELARQASEARAAQAASGVPVSR